MGGKKGGSSYTPKEAKETGRSFQILRILEVISEGEIAGLVNDMKSVYLDKTPLANDDGTFNFKNISITARNGSQTQTTIPDFNSVEKEVSVGSKIVFKKPIIKTINDVNVTRLRMTLGVERLMITTEQGDIKENSVTLKITILKDNKIYDHYLHTFSGKYSNSYREMVSMNSLPKAPFQIKVERLNAESTSVKKSDGAFWSSYTEIIDEEFTYPNTALVGIKIDSDYFSQVPARNYEIYGLIVKVPSNYDPFNHTYTNDFWNGEFKLSWTNNPAWVLYDLVTNTRYGIGTQMEHFGIDKWQLYAIARYCDELVPDGFGGTEPRMTCNVWLTSQRKAYDLIMDLCSVFRAMPVWNGQALSAVQDRTADPVWSYTQANIVGSFNRQRSARKARHNVIHVEYIDRSDFYEKKIETVTDDQLVVKYGANVKKVTAFGCTSRGQAQRTGRWILETEKLETEVVTFTVGQEGLMHLPYDIIEIADNEYSGLNIGGRILSGKGTSIVLDRTIEIDDKSYLSYISADGTSNTVKILRFDKNKNIATVAKNIGTLEQYSIWTLQTKRITTGLYRTLSIKENTSGENKTFTITAMQHVPEKEDIVINGTYFQPKPQTIYGEETSLEILNQDGNVSIRGKIVGTQNPLLSKSITSYSIKLLKNGVLLYIKHNLSSPDISFDDLENGSYEVTINAYNAQRQLINSTTKSFVVDRPPIVTGIEINAHLGSVILEWNYVNDVTQTQILASEINDIQTAKLVTTVLARQYTHEIGAEQTRYYWLRHKRGTNLGLFDQIQGRVCTTGKDLKKQLKELDKELKRNVIDEFFTTALPARKLDLVLTVANVTNPTTFLQHKMLYNEADGKIWIWNGTKYVADSTEILASAIKGIIQPNQLASIPTAKISGQITDQQIRSIGTNKLAGVISVNNLPSIPTTKLSGFVSDEQIQAVNATKLIGTVPISAIPTVPTSKLTGLLTSDQIQSLNATKISGNLQLSALPSIPTTKLTGSITARQIQANSIGANHIASNAVTSDKILSGAVTTEKLTANSVTVDKIASNAVTADKLNANSVTADKIATNSITSTKIQANSVTTDKIASNSINASKITANAIETRHVKANAIGANHIASNSIATTHIQANSINASKIQANSIGANAIQANAVTADKLQANSVTSAKIQASAIRTDHLSAGSVSADKLTIGLGGNLLTNPIFANEGYDWHTNNGSLLGFNIVREFRGYKNEDWYLHTALENERLLKIRYGGNVGSTSITNKWCDILATYARVIPNKWYIFSAYMRSYRCNSVLLVSEVNSETNSHIRGVATSPASGDFDGADNTGQFDKGFDKAKRFFIKFKAPASGKVRLAFRTNRFQANTGNPDCYVARPMLEECTEYSIEPSQWENSGVTAIHGGSIVAKTITAQQIQANSITANEIAGNTITGDKIQSNTITARHVKSQSISADKLKVNSLSAITSNLGYITGGSLNIANKFKVDSNGILTATNGNFSGNITGSVIQGGEIRGARFIGATGDFTGTLVVSSLLGNEVDVYSKTTNYQRIGYKQISSRHCWEDENNTRRKICEGQSVWSHQYRSDLTFEIPALNEETIISIPTLGEILSTTPIMKNLLGVTGKVANAGQSYTIVVRVNKSTSTSSNADDKPAPDTISLKRNRRF